MGQIAPDPIAAYIAGLHGPAEPLIEEVEAAGRAAGLPLVDPSTARLLRSLVIATDARQVLEIGTAIGYSALWMGLVLPEEGRLISLEIDPERAATARRYVERAGLGSRVSVIVGDAARLLHKLAGPFDLVFQDGAKRLYEPLLDGLIALLRPGGVLITDNVLWNGEVVPGFIEHPTRDAADARAIQQYNERLSRETRLTTVFLPVGDGVALSVRVDER